MDQYQYLHLTSPTHWLGHIRYHPGDPGVLIQCSGRGNSLYRVYTVVSDLCVIQYEPISHSQVTQSHSKFEKVVQLYVISLRLSGNISLVHKNLFICFLLSCLSIFLYSSVPGKLQLLNLAQKLRCERAESLYRIMLYGTKQPIKLE